MATTTERQRLRMDLGLQPDDAASLSDDIADDIYAEAGEFYADAGSAYAYARVIAIERLMAQAAPQVDYTQNESSEKSSQLTTNYQKLLERWQGKLDKAIALASGSTARFGRTQRIPARRRVGW